MRETIAGADRSHRVFAHLVAEKAAAYRAVLAEFSLARERFTIHLRPGEVARQTGGTDEETEGLLAQLVEWGNLERSPDTAEAATIEEFHRARFLYQLSAAGEAAEEALLRFHEILGRPGELQTMALRDITRFLDVLRQLLLENEPDVAKLHAQLRELNSTFRELTTQAQAFIRGLHGTVELHGIGAEEFQEYKTALIGYIERFIGELVLATNEIAGKIEEVEAAGIAARLPAVAERDLSDRLERTPEDDRETLARWEGKWQGLRRWFIGGGGPSQAEILRARAREAVPALLFTLQNLNDRRLSKSDRVADWQTLALWFAEAPDEDDCHRLWRAAFGLAPARHLRHLRNRCGPHRLAHRGAPPPLAENRSRYRAGPGAGNTRHRAPRRPRPAPPRGRRTHPPAAGHREVWVAGRTGDGRWRAVALAVTFAGASLSGFFP